MFAKPQFLVVAPFRTGTTWLYTQLCYMNGVKMPPYKELNFFFDADMQMQLEAFKKSGQVRPDISVPHISPEMVAQAISNLRTTRLKSYHEAKNKVGFFWAQYYYRIPRNFEWLSLCLYTRLFKTSNDEVTGDVSPAYFTLSPGTIGLIKKKFPAIKVVIILRDPVEREWSNISMHHIPSAGNEGFSMAGYLKRHDLQFDYITAINNWEQFFDSQSLCYLFYDELLADKKRFMDKLIRFLKPGITVTEWVDQKIGESGKAGITPEIKSQLITRNLPQYKFLAEKFGPGSYPAKWLERINSR